MKEERERYDLREAAMYRFTGGFYDWRADGFDSFGASSTINFIRPLNMPTLFVCAALMNQSRPNSISLHVFRILFRIIRFTEKIIRPKSFVFKSHSAAFNDGALNQNYMKATWHMKMHENEPHDFIHVLFRQARNWKNFKYARSASRLSSSRLKKPFITLNTFLIQQLATMMMIMAINVNNVNNYQRGQCKWHKSIQHAVVKKKPKQRN